ncbi:MAG: ankyrin repeat domain-containing protein, partial [Legionellales bacterium]|nr:ankyrin repeat domain-containing protein [Legionellales bacterium]
MKNYDKIAKQVYEYENAYMRKKEGSTLKGSEIKRNKLFELNDAKGDLTDNTIENLKENYKQISQVKKGSIKDYLFGNILSRLATSRAMLVGDEQEYGISLFDRSYNKSTFYNLNELELLGKTMLARSEQLGDAGARNSANLKEALNLITYSKLFAPQQNVPIASSDKLKVFEAIIQKDIKKLISIMTDKDFDTGVLSTADMNGDTPLMLAVKLKQYDIIKLICAKDTNLNAGLLQQQNKYGLNAYDLAKGKQGKKERKVYKTLNDIEPEPEAKAEQDVEGTTAATTADTIKVELQKAISEGHFSQIESSIASSLFNGVSDDVFNKYDVEGAVPFLHQIVGIKSDIGSDIDQRTLDQYKLSAFKLLLNAGADPKVNATDTTPIFTSILKAAEQSVNHSIAFNMLQELTTRGITIPDDQRRRSLTEAAVNTKSIKILSYLDEYHGLNFTDEQNEQIQGMQRGREFLKIKSKEKPETVNPAEKPEDQTTATDNPAEKLKVKSTATDKYRDNLVWDWLRKNRPWRESRKVPRLENPKSVVAINDSKAELGDMDTSRIEKDVALAVTQGDNWEGWLNQLKTLHNAVAVVTEFVPIFKEVYARHEKACPKGKYYKKENLANLKKLVESNLKSLVDKRKIEVTSDISEKRDPTDKLNEDSQYQLLISKQKEVFSIGDFQDPNSKITKPGNVASFGIADGYKAHIDRYRTDPKRVEPTDDQRTVEAVPVDAERVGVLPVAVVAAVDAK